MQSDDNHDSTSKGVKDQPVEDEKVVEKDDQETTEKSSSPKAEPPSPAAVN